MFNNKKHQHEIETLELNNRINELEEIICPFDQHEYIEIGSNYIDTSDYNYTDGYLVKTLKCKKCRKINTTTKRY